MGKSQKTQKSVVYLALYELNICQFLRKKIYYTRQSEENENKTKVLLNHVKKQDRD